MNKLEYYIWLYGTIVFVICSIYLYYLGYKNNSKKIKSISKVIFFLGFLNFLLPIAVLFIAFGGLKALWIFIPLLLIIAFLLFRKK